MKFSTKLLDHNLIHKPCVLTVGFFDGVHIGHQYLLKKLNEIKGSTGFSYVITFSNHPKTILTPDTTVPLISSTSQRIQLIQDQFVDSLIMLPFTKELKERSPDDFISELLEKTAFTDLILGPDSTLGKDKEGDHELIRLLSRKYSFKLHLIDYVKVGAVTVSSSLARKKIQEGDFEMVKKILGRPYSIRATICQGEQQGQKIGFPTMNFEVEGLCLPPNGVYKVLIKNGSSNQKAIANLGYAPTLKARKTPLLEVHLLEGECHNYGEELEIIFETFIREERKFSSVDDLKAQIFKDIESARKS